MAILSAAELKASREAELAGVDIVDDSAAESAIALAEAVMNKALGYKVANSATTLTIQAAESDRLLLSERVRSISGITEAILGGSATTVSDLYEIRNDGFSVWRNATWRNDSTVVITGAFGFATTDDEYVLAKQFVLSYAVRHLANTDATNNMAGPGGAVLTGFASENASFQYFTPIGESTGYQDLDKLLDQIGRHPNKSRGLYTISLSRGDRDFTFDDIVSGRYEGDIAG